MDDLLHVKSIRTSRPFGIVVVAGQNVYKMKYTEPKL